MALFSCNVTKAVLSSELMQMYSGSRSDATVAFGPKMRIPAARRLSISPLNDSKVNVVTLSEVIFGMPGNKLMMLTEPNGSIV